jgi:hypothetical protein
MNKSYNPHYPLFSLLPIIKKENRAMVFPEKAFSLDI